MPEEPVKTQPDAPHAPSEDILHSDTLFPDWSTVEHARHNLRVVCDQEGLTLEQKNTLCATIAVESGFHIHATHRNYAFVNGIRKLLSTDWGICQWNDHYHGKEITPDKAMNDPEKAVRLMCKYWKQGLRNQWVAYSSGLYKKYL